MRRDDRVTLTQILERIERIETSGVDRAHFLGQPWDQDALIRNLEVIGEATKRLSDEVRRRSPEIEWSQVAGFREVTIHGYDTVSLERTWVIVVKELPRLKSAVRRLLRSLDWG